MPEISQEFRWYVPDLGGVQKSLCNKQVCGHYSDPHPEEQISRQTSTNSLDFDSQEGF